MSWDCRQSVQGQHGRTDVQGRCLMCGVKIEAALPFAPSSAARRQAARAQDPLSIDGPDDADYFDGWGAA